MNIPTTIDLKYSTHAKSEWSDRLGFIKNPPKKFFRLYNKYEKTSDENKIRAIFPYVSDKRYNLILIVDIPSGTVITNYLKRNNERMSNQSRILPLPRKR